MGKRSRRSRRDRAEREPTNPPRLSQVSARSSWLATSYFVFVSLASAHRVLDLFANNMREIFDYNSLYLPLVTSVGGANILFLLLSWCWRDKAKGFLATLVLVFVFFSYDLIERSYGRLFAVNNSSGPSLWYVFSGILAVVAVAFWLIQRLCQAERVGRIAAVFVAALALSSLVRIAANAQVLLGGQGVIRALRERLLTPTRGTLPDVYYIVLDAYARNDVLQALFNYDNRWFTDTLRDEGFFVADRSKANYPTTSISLMSSLNMKYISDGTACQRRPALSAFRYNQLFRVFKGMGYKLVHIKSGIGLTNNVPTADQQIETGHFDEFATILLNTTLLKPVLARTGDMEISWQRRIQSSFRVLGNLATPSPKFVLAHLLIPHPPFVFDANGEVNKGAITSISPFDDESWNLDRKYYVNYLIYANKRILEVVRRILRRDPDAIIVLQGDHGPATQLHSKPETEGDRIQHPQKRDRSKHQVYDRRYLRERVRILNAYHVPSRCREGFYAEISPVNSFRNILRRCYGLDYELLEDLSYFRLPYCTNEYEWLDVTKIVDP